VPGRWRRRLQRIPTAIIVFVLGLVLAFVRRPHVLRTLRVGPATPHVYSTIKAAEWRKGFVSAAIPQIPLSVLNSVIAVCKLAGDLYGHEKGELVSPTKVSVSVGLMNLVGCWFGAAPACHGAGGLAGQWRFGARSGAAVVFLGLLKLLLGLLLGSSMARLLEAYPVSILGVLLFYAGLELAMACRDQTDRADSFVTISSAAMAIASNSAAIGFVFSLVIHILFHLPDVTRQSFSDKLSSLIPRRLRRTSTTTTSV
jgi:MFS superfamily sulfate permease-like transporter